MQAQKTNKARLGRFTIIIMMMTAISRLCGFARDVIFAHIFGASAALDAFVIAFKIPNFMRRLFGEGAFSQAFVPVLVRQRTQDGEVGIQLLINRMVAAMGISLLVLVLLAEIAAPLLVYLFAPGFSRDAQKFALAEHLIRITFPYVFSIGLVALAGAVLNTFNRFALSAFTPVILNLFLIAASLCLIPHVSSGQQVIILSWAVMLSGLVQLIIQWPALRRLKLTPKPQWYWRDPRIQQVFKQLLPALLGVSMMQISLLVDNFFASFLPSGSISWLYYSDRLIYFPLGLIGVALATAVMPHLSHQHHIGKPELFSAALDWALRCTLVIAVPASLGLILLSGPILSVLMHHGAFTSADVYMTRRSLMAFAAALPALMMIKVLATAYYAQHNMRTPAWIAGSAVLINVGLNFVFIIPLHHAGLALATALASWFNAVLLWVFLKKNGIYKMQSEWRRLIFGITVGSLLMLVTLLLGTATLFQWLSWSSVRGLGHLLILVASGIVVYSLGLWLCGLRWCNFKYRE